MAFVQKIRLNPVAIATWAALFVCTGASAQALSFSTVNSTGGGKLSNQIMWLTANNVNATTPSTGDLGTFTVDVNNGSALAKQLSVQIGLESIAGFTTATSYAFTNEQFGYVVPANSNIAFLLDGVGSAAVNFSKIELHNKAGELLQFDWVIADAEQTNPDWNAGGTNPETIGGTSDGSDWSAVDTVTSDVGDGSSAASTTSLALLGKSFKVTGTGGWSYPIAYVVKTSNASNISATMTVPGGNQKIAAGVIPKDPQASITCDKAQLTDSENQVANCTVSVVNPPLSDYQVTLASTGDPRYSTTCNGAISIKANVATAQCTLTATPNNVVADGNVAATISVTDVGSYLVDPNAKSFAITVADDDVAVPPVQVITSPTPVPAMGPWALMALSGLMALLLGWRRSKTQ